MISQEILVKELKDETKIVIPANTSTILIDFVGKNREIIVKKNAEVKIFTCHTNSTSENVQIFLSEPGATSKLFTLFSAKNEDKITLQGTCIHQASDTHSNMVVKGIVKDSAIAKYDGLVKVKENAKGCTGYQQEHTLLLGDEAQATIIPNLEIANDDVQCSHGATIGRIDEEQLFYLTSRGIPKKEAIKLLITGFFETIIVFILEICGLDNVTI